ncbi:MAG: hypothetical protein M5U19_15480 [Microthrixaceae bacterium]|nr:hypothetical protein [Microthrixaceae bacterium]
MAEVVERLFDNSLDVEQAFCALWGERVFVSPTDAPRSNVTPPTETGYMAAVVEFGTQSAGDVASRSRVSVVDLPGPEVERMEHPVDRRRRSAGSSGHGRWPR